MVPKNFWNASHPAVSVHVLSTFTHPLRVYMFPAILGCVQSRDLCNLKIALHNLGIWKLRATLEIALAQTANIAA